MKQVCLSSRGGDRATAYTMSNKIVCLPGGLVCTWIDCDRQNQWALVDYDGQGLRTGLLGEVCEDNHCGAALAQVEGSLHAIIGAHHGPLQHYRLDDPGAGDWKHLGAIDARATYPSLVSDRAGRLHLAFRSPGERWTLNYSRFDGRTWRTPRPLVVADKPGYIYWTNGLAVGGGDQLHLLLGNTRVLDGGELLYSASHLVSTDAGDTWLTDDCQPLDVPAAAADVPMVTRGLPTERIQPRTAQEACSAPGPANLNYQQLLLSNPVVDERGALHVVLHNGLTGEADLMSRCNGAWNARPLTSLVKGAASASATSCRIHMQSSLALGPGGALYVSLMVEPTDACIWGPAGTHIVRVTMPVDGREAAVEPVTAFDPDCAQWLPAQAHVNPQPAMGQNPPMLYTRGVNAGGFGNNQNIVQTEVWLAVG